MISRGKLISLAKFGFALSLIAYLIWRGHLDLKVLSRLWAPEPLVLGVSLVGMTVLLQSWRWRLLLHCRGFSTSYAEVTRLFLIGTFFNYALPGSIGGDVVKAFYIAQDHPARRVDAVLTVILDRLLGLYAMIAVALAAMLFNWDKVMGDLSLRGLALGTFLIFILMSCFWTAAFSRRFSRLLKVEEWLQLLPFKEKLLRIFRATQAYSLQKVVLLRVVGLSAAAQLISIFFMMVVGHYTGHGAVPVGAYFFAVPLGFIASSLPVSPAGLGVGQVAFLVLFEMYLGTSSTLGQTAITAFQMVLLGWGLIGAVLYLKRGANFNPAAETP